MTGRPVFPDGAVPAWMADAACQGMDTNLFYFERGAANGSDSRAVRQTCAGCPVQTECLDYALEHETHGFWGGLSERQRRNMRLAGRRRLRVDDALPKGSGGDLVTFKRGGR